MENKKLTDNEATAILTNLLCCKLFLLTPSVFTANSGSGALLTVCLVFAAAFAAFGLYIKICGARPALPHTRNPIVKTLFGTLTFFLLLFCGAATFSRILYYAKAMAYPKTPLIFLALPLAAASTFCAYTKSVGKTHGFFVPALYAALLVLVLLSAKSFHFTNLTPLFGKGFRTVFGNGFFLLSSLFEMVVLLYMPALTSTSFRKIGLRALSASFFCYIFVIGGFLLIGGNTQNLPVFAVIRSSFFSRTDSVFLLLYALSGMLYLAAVIYFSAHIFGKTFNVPRTTPLIIPITLIILSFTEIGFLNTKEQFIIKNLQNFLWTIPFLLPLCFAFFPDRDRKKAKPGKEKEKQ